MKEYLKKGLFLTILFEFCSVAFAQQVEITHGPMLGHVTNNSIRIWARTSAPGSFSVEYVTVEDTISEPDWSQAMISNLVVTKIENDNTGWIEIGDLQPQTQYAYQVVANKEQKVPGGVFKTLPQAEDYVNEYNPKGLFNFKFEYGSCASQNPANGLGPSLPAYNTMLDQVRGNIDFAIMNGDWLYEEARDYPPVKWRKSQAVTEKTQPKLVEYAPTVVGVWENYKIYMDRAKNLAEWHRYVPSYFTFDDHELINDIWGAGSPGHRNRRAVFRDIGTAAWYDYLGWADPIFFDQDVHFGKAKLKKGSSLLKDPKADFTKLDLDNMASLHVHWGTTTAGVDDTKYDVDEEGDPNSKVYAVEDVINKKTLKISPPAVANGSQSYSIGRNSYGKFRVSNCDFFLLDTKTYREYHDTSEPDKPGLTLIGDKQREWLKAEMKNSDADFFFVSSTVPFMIPHRGAGGYAKADNKDEAWTVFLDEREKLISFWEELGKPVFVLTGDLHNSFAIKITDQVWEFCSGPHNSVNHRLTDEGGRPKSGSFNFDVREMDIRWSTFVLPDIPRPERMFPHYCVVKINNVFNNPLKMGDERWVAYEHPQVIFQFFDGLTGELVYAEAVSTKRD